MSLKLFLPNTSYSNIITVCKIQFKVFTSIQNYSYSFCLQNVLLTLLLLLFRLQICEFNLQRANYSFINIVAHSHHQLHMFKIHSTTLIRQRYVLYQLKSVRWKFKILFGKISLIQLQTNGHLQQRRRVTGKNHVGESSRIQLEKQRVQLKKTPKQASK